MEFLHRARNNRGQTQRMSMLIYKHLSKRVIKKIKFLKYNILFYYIYFKYNILSLFHFIKFKGEDEKYRSYGATTITIENPSFNVQQVANENNNYNKNNNNNTSNLMR